MGVWKIKYCYFKGTLKKGSAKEKKKRKKKKTAKHVIVLIVSHAKGCRLSPKKSPKSPQKSKN